ncbi:MAG: hypothetical protein R3D29_08955 [Nitratireductor sp.]
MLLRAGELTPVEKAERRVLVLPIPVAALVRCRPHPRSILACNTLPGETAPAHDTPFAVRIIVEGKGGFRC